MRKQILFTLIFCLSGSLLFAQTDATSKIRKEGLENSKVMDIAFHLTDVSGPGLPTLPDFSGPPIGQKMN